MGTRPQTRPRPVDGGSWRVRFRPLVAELVEMIRTCNMDEDHAKMEFRVAWELWGIGYSRYWPYKVWRDEVARQMGWRHGRLTPRSKRSLPEWYRQHHLEAAGQQRLFDA